MKTAEHFAVFGRSNKEKEEEKAFWLSNSTLLVLTARSW